LNIDISIVLPTYNRSYLLKKVLDSIQNSESLDAINYEVIIVDNNSTDSTRLISQEYEKKTPGIFRYIFEPRQGLSYSRNRGIVESRGKHIAFTDDDQLVDPLWLKSIYDTFAKYNADCVGGKIKYQIPSNVPEWLNRLLEENPNSIGQLDFGNSLFQVKTPKELPKGGNMAFSREVLNEDIHFDVNIGRIGKKLLVGEDTKLLKQLLKSGKKIIYQPNAIIYHILEKPRYTKKYWRKEAFGRGQSIIISSHYSEKTLQIFIKLIGDILYYLIKLLHRQNNTFQIQLSLYRRFGELYQSIKSNLKQC